MDHLLLNTQKMDVLLKESLICLKKRNLSLDEYLNIFKIICDNLKAINKLLEYEIYKVFQLARGLRPKYKDFRLIMLAKPLYSSYN